MTAQGAISGGVDNPVEGTLMDDRESKSGRSGAVPYRSLFSDEYRAKGSREAIMIMDSIIRSTMYAVDIADIAINGAMRGS